jgi:hypothetical protein
MLPDNTLTRACFHVLTFILGLIAPIAFAYSLHYVWTGDSSVLTSNVLHSLPNIAVKHVHLISTVIHYWLAAEVIFFINFWNSRRILQRASDPIHISKSERAALFWNCVHTIDDVKEWFCGWFYIEDGNNTRPTFEQIKLGNVQTW